MTDYLQCVNFTYDGFDRLTKRTYDFWLNSDTGKRFTSTASYTFVTKQSGTSTQVQSYTFQIGSHAALRCCAKEQNMLHKELGL